jgi:hypothetical protein
MPHLLVALTAHGFGHGAQTAAVVNALRASRPDVTLTLRTTLPSEFLQRRFAGDFTLVPENSDVGMIMASAVEIRLEDTARAYAHWHRDWKAHVTREAAWLRAQAPDLVLANVPYLPLAGAARAGIAAVAMCSLNWADIYHHYFRARPEAARIEAEMRAAYHAARLFLRLAPAMPMADLPNAVDVAPVANVGRNRRAEIARALGLNADTRLVLIAPGGIDLRLPIERWPVVRDIHWLVPADWGAQRTGVSALEALRLPFTDVLCSCDAVIGKPGYGTFTEAGCNGVPMLYLPRGDWPEAPHLTAWLARHGRAAPIDRARLERGELTAALKALWSQPAPPRVVPHGITLAVERLAEFL